MAPQDDRDGGRGPAGTGGVGATSTSRRPLDRLRAVLGRVWGTARASLTRDEEYPPGGTAGTLTVGSALRTDGGTEEQPVDDEPDADGDDSTAFVWGGTRSPDEHPDASGTAEGDDVDVRLDAIERQLEALAETAEDLTLLALNTHLKLARREPEALDDVAYDLEADAKTVGRAAQQIAVEVAELREQLGEDGGSPGGPEAAHPDAGKGDGQDEIAPSEPPGEDAPGTVAGVDPSEFPGDLGPYDFEHARRAVEAATDPAELPPSVTEAELSDDEVPFEVLLAIADADDPADGAASSGEPPDDPSTAGSEPS